MWIFCFRNHYAPIPLGRNVIHYTEAIMFVFSRDISNVNVFLPFLLTHLHQTTFENEKFLLLSQCFQKLILMCLYPFPHTANPQKITFKTPSQKYKFVNLYKLM